MAKVSKRYKAAKEQIDRTKVYPVEEAIALAKKASSAKFDETVELSFNLNVDPRHADQQIRGSVVLPYGTGKTQRVAVVAEGDKAKEALEAGADIVGADEFIQEIQQGRLDFDVLITTPNMMGKLGRLGRILGPKGLMPNPKSGTISQDLRGAIEAVRKGKVNYRVDKAGNINLLIGKVSFDDDQLLGNFQTVYDVIKKARPSKVKGTYMKNLVISTTMGPGIHVEIK
ncbi:MAG: 50S ribosomal protein L1 [Allobaculum sp.]|nr:50S ribosomal protein L1 [Allobaculum sp.]